MIKYVGSISREKVNELYGKNKVGLLLYQPAKNHFEAQPIKMFEYMAAGIPLICSNFPLWKRIVETNECGMCVDCQDVSVVRQAIEKLINDDRTLKVMAENGYKAVTCMFNWDIEKNKLIELYSDIEGDK